MKTVFKWTKGNLAVGALAAFWVLYLLTFFFDRSEGKKVFLQISPMLVDAMKWDTLAFLGFNVLDNAGKGKFYQAGLVASGTEEK